MAGYQESEYIQQGQSGTAIEQSSTEYFTDTAGSVTIDPVASTTVYQSTGGSGAETTPYSYTFFSGTTQIQSVTTTLPTITTAQNGSNSANTTTTYYNQYQQAIWTKDANGYLTYTTYDPATGAVTEQIQDVNTSDTSEFSNLPSGWTTPTGGGLNLITTYEVDVLGRVIETTDPNGNVTYVVYNDPSHEVFTYVGWDSTTDRPTGPTQVTRQDWADGYDETFTMSVAPALTSGVPKSSDLS
ncbi:MAG TPA: hypothetical protein VG122_24365 [Gemmata sp.]|nr:hypothetical protein [Gemmata sp.]